MADITNLTNFLGDIANAIRTKKETTEQIPAENFDQEILSIDTIKGQEKTIIPSTAEQIITPDGDYNAITKATVKAVDSTIDSNISPENIRKDINILGVTGTLEEGEQINNQDKEITTNGTYTADEGYTGLGTVTVNVPSTGDVPVKLFATQEEMQADNTAKEGDLAVVYRSELKNATVDSRFQTATFPDTVVLDTAITDYVEVRYRPVDSSVMFDCMGELNSSSFMMDCYTETGEVRIRYTSSDGITYTRTDTTGNPVDFGTQIYYEMADMWNDAIGKFIQIGGSTFEGLFEYKTFKNENKIHTYSYSELTWDSSTKNLTGTGGEVIEFDIETILNKITEYTETNFSDYRSGTFNGNPIYEYMLYYDNNCIVFPFATQNEGNPYKYLRNLDLIVDNTTWKVTGGTIITNISFTHNLYEIRVNITTGQISCELLEENFTGGEYQPLTRFNNYKFVGNINKNGVFNYEFQDGLLDILYYSAKDSTWYSSNCIYGEKPGIDDIKYLIANTQLNTTPDYVYEKEFYGKDGVGTGTLTQDISNSFTDMNAEVYGKIQNYYDNLEPRVLTDSDKTIDTNIYCIPAKSDGTPLLDTSSVTGMIHMFEDCDNLTTIPLLNTSSVTNMSYMFNGCDNLTTIPLLNTSNVTNMSDMFRNCTNLKEIPQLNTSKVASIGYMFYNCTSLQTIPLLDTSRATNMIHMFEGCNNLTTIPLLDTSSVTNMHYMFHSCTNLTTIPQLDTSSVTDMYYMFYNCTNLTEIPQLNTSKATNIAGMFYGCTNLTTVPLLNTSKVTSMSDMFNGCTSLSDESLNNILAMCKNATSYPYTKTLAYIGLTSEQANKCKSLSNYSRFTAAGWTTGY